MGKFVLKKTSDEQYMFNLKASNGQVIATSEHYTTRQNALDGIDAVKREAPGAWTDDET